MAGATVIATGRSRPGRTTEGLAGTIDDTAAAFAAAGGEGIAFVCDHADDAAVAAMFARHAGEDRVPDVLVNSTAAGS